MRQPLGKRVKNWKTAGTSANAEVASASSTIRNRARDLKRNSPYAQKIVQSFSSNVIGTGILPSSTDAIFLNLFNQWANSTDSDDNEKVNFYSIQRMAMEALVETGEVLIVKQYGKNKVIPLQLKILESDFIDSSKNNLSANLIQGIQFDDFGKTIGYWLFNKHPGDINSTSKLVSANDVIHLFRIDRPGQTRGISWLAPVIVQLKRLDDFEVALLEKQLISNLFAGFIYDNNGVGTGTSSTLELEPGSLLSLSPR